MEALALITADDIANDCSVCNGDLDIAKKALKEVKASYEKSYNKLEAGQGTTSNYEYLAPGIATLPNDDTFYIWGLCVHKEVITPGTYKPVNSAVKTKVKRYIERLTPASKFRRFKLTPGTYSHVSVGGVKV
jgi:hypothetical protein